MWFRSCDYAIWARSDLRCGRFVQAALLAGSIETGLSAGGEPHPLLQQVTSTLVKSLCFLGLRGAVLAGVSQEPADEEDVSAVLSSFASSPSGGSPRPPSPSPKMSRKVHVASCYFIVCPYLGFLASGITRLAARIWRFQSESNCPF